MDADRYADAYAQNVALPANVLACISTIRVCEGTDAAEGWRALYGWRPGRADRLFYGDEHPRVRFWIKSGYPWQPGEVYGPLDTTTAAGALMINWPTWGDFQAWRAKQGLSVARFDQAGQTACGVWLIQERACAWDDLIAGDLESALGKMAPIWASLPGSRAGQHPKSLSLAQTAYLNAGGVLA